MVVPVKNNKRALIKLGHVGSEDTPVRTNFVRVLVEIDVLGSEPFCE